MDADPHLEVPSIALANVDVQRMECALDPECGGDGTAGSVLDRERRPEERHDAVAEELVHRSLVPVHLLEDELERTVHEGMHLLGVEALGERRRICEVAEEDRDVLAFAFERASRLEDPLRQVPGRVGARLLGRGGRLAERGTAVVAEGRPGRVLVPTVLALGGKGGTAAVAEA